MFFGRMKVKSRKCVASVKGPFCSFFSHEEAVLGEFSMLRLEN